MHSLTAFLKRYRFDRMLIVLAAGIILFVNTACSPSSPSASGSGSYTSKVEQPTELYDTVQEPKGGMNVYPDTDPRRSRDDLSAKASERIRQAEQNLNKVQSREELADEVKAAAPFKQGIQDVTERVGSTVEELKEDFSEGTARGMQNLKRNAEQAREGVKDTVESATDNLQDTADDVSGKVNRAARGATGTGEFARDRA